MNAKDLENMSAHELKHLIKSAQERIDELEAMEQLEIMEKIQTMARQAGLEVLLKPANKRTRKRSKMAPKYKNPANPDETWTGYGRKPKWAQEALESGKTLEDLAV